MSQSTNSLKNLSCRLFKFVLVIGLDGQFEQFNSPLLADYLLNIKDITRRNIPISSFVLSRDTEKLVCLIDVLKDVLRFQMLCRLRVHIRTLL